MKALWCAGRQLWVDDALAELAEPRVHVAAFTEAPRDTPLLYLRWVRGLKGTELRAPMGDATVRLDGDVLEVDFEDGIFRAELTLRLAYAVMTERLGGVLIHASAVAFGERGLVASGVSGTGKSTLARHALASGAELLSDEIAQLFPDGRLAGTPFRSDTEQPSTPRLVRAAYFAGVRKADTEALEPLSSLDATLLALSQCFEAPVVPATRVESRRRLMAFLGATQLGTIACRNHPATGDFVRALLGGETR
ncbi:MAG: hypothetical protein JNG84_00770 [Archangium sp.]|nr:hypothetical protein [Archangium sp.]